MYIMLYVRNQSKLAVPYVRCLTSMQTINIQARGVFLQRVLTLHRHNNHDVACSALVFATLYTAPVRNSPQKFVCQYVLV